MANWKEVEFRFTMHSLLKPALKRMPFPKALMILSQNFNAFPDDSPFSSVMQSMNLWRQPSNTVALSSLSSVNNLSNYWSEIFAIMLPKRLSSFVRMSFCLILYAGLSKKALRDYRVAEGLSFRCFSIRPCSISFSDGYIMKITMNISLLAETDEQIKKRPPT